MQKTTTLKSPFGKTLFGKCLFGKCTQNLVNAIKLFISELLVNVHSVNVNKRQKFGKSPFDKSLFGKCP